MIAPSNTYRIFLTTTSVDFRKGMDGLANYVRRNFDLDQRWLGLSEQVSGVF